MRGLSSNVGACSCADRARAEALGACAASTLGERGVGFDDVAHRRRRCRRLRRPRRRRRAGPGAPRRRPGRPRRRRDRPGDASSAAARIAAPVRRARAAADDRDALDARAGLAQRVQAVGEREGDAFEHRRPPGPRRRCRGCRPKKHAARVRVVVRRALAGQVGQEELGAVAAQAARPRPRRAAPPASPAPVSARHPVDAARRADSITAIWCQRVRAGSGRRRARRARGSGGSASLATKSTPEVPSERNASPGRDHADADRAGGVVAAAAGDRRRAPCPSAAATSARSVPVGSVPSTSARHVRARRGRSPPASRPTRRACATSSQSVPAASDMSLSLARRSGAGARSPWAAAPCATRANTSGSCSRTHSSFGAVKPGMARLPVMRASSRLAALELGAFGARCGRRSTGSPGAATRSAASSSVAPCIWPDEADGRAPRERSARAAQRRRPRCVGRPPPVLGILLGPAAAAGAGRRAARWPGRPPLPVVDQHRLHARRAEVDAEEDLVQAPHVVLWPGGLLLLALS